MRFWSWKEWMEFEMSINGWNVLVCGRYFDKWFYKDVGKFFLRVVSGLGVLFVRRVDF